MRGEWCFPEVSGVSHSFIPFQGNKGWRQGDVEGGVPSEAKEYLGYVPPKV